MNKKIINVYQTFYIKVIASGEIKRNKKMSQMKLNGREQQEMKTFERCK